MFCVHWQVSGKYAQQHFQIKKKFQKLINIYGMALHDSKVAQSWVILLRLWQVTVTFMACKKGSNQPSQPPQSGESIYRTQKSINYPTQSKPNQLWKDDLTKEIVKICINSITIRTWTKLSNTKKKCNDRFSIGKYLGNMHNNLFRSKKISKK